MANALVFSFAFLALVHLAASTNSCANWKCNNHGTCVEDEGGPICVCGADPHGNSWSGVACSIPTCDNSALNSCNGDHGSCRFEYHASSKEFSQYCLCGNLWTGAACDQPSCALLNGGKGCGNRGTCRVNSQGLQVCHCTGTDFIGNGWSLNDCSRPLCDALDSCNGRGTCMFTPHSSSHHFSQYCVCSGDWTGATCNIPTCKSLNYCNGHGFCTSDNTCQCDSADWTGASCNDRVPCGSLNNCNGHGQCTHRNGEWICVCSNYQVWTGLACATRTCDIFSTLSFCTSLGDVTLWQTPASAVSNTVITQITGSLLVYACNSLTSFSASLSTINGDLQFSSNDALTQILMPNLQSVSNFQVSSNGLLSVITLGDSIAITGQIYICSNAPALSYPPAVLTAGAAGSDACELQDSQGSCSTGVFGSCACDIYSTSATCWTLGDVDLSQISTLTIVDNSVLSVITGSLLVYACNSLTSFSTSQLTAINGDLQFSSNDALTQILMPNLQSVSNFQVSSNGLLSVITLNNIMTISGQIYICANALPLDYSSSIITAGAAGANQCEVQDNGGSNDCADLSPKDWPACE